MMRSNTVSTLAKERTTSSWRGVTGFTVQDVPYTSNQFIVTNGEAAGDFVKPTVMSFNKTLHEKGPKTISRRGLNLYDEYTTLIEGYASINPLTFFPTDVTDFQSGLVQSRVMSKIYDQLRGSANLSVDAFESAQTIRMLRGTLNLKKFIGSFLDGVTKSPGWSRRFAQERTNTNKFVFRDKPLYIQPLRGPAYTVGQKRLDYVTERWLEVRYGWMPLVSTIYDALDTLNSYRSQRTFDVKARSSASSERTLRAQTETIHVGGKDVRRYVMTVQASYRLERTLSFSLPNGLELYDFTTIHPGRFAWEVVPFSFVADWICNVGSVLEEFENFTIYSKHFSGGFQTLTTREIKDATYWRDYTNSSILSDGVTLEVSSESARVTMKSKDRSQLFALPYDAGLRISSNLNSKRLLDSAALIHQLIAKKLR